MVTQIHTNIAVARKKGKNGNVEYRSPRIYLPTKLTDDSSFPFLEGEEVRVRIEGARLVVERVKRGRLVNRGARRKDKGGRLGGKDSRRKSRARRPGGEALRRVNDRTAE